MPTLQAICSSMKINHKIDLIFFSRGNTDEQIL